MNVPSVKTLIIYKNQDKSIRVLCNEFLGVQEKYRRIENEIENRNPFQEDYKERFECYPKAENTYSLSIYQGTKPTFTIDVTIVTVLEFMGKIFELKETDYDQTEYDY